MTRRRDFIGLAAAGLAAPAFATAAQGREVAWTGADYQARRKFVRTQFGNIAYVEQGAGKAALFLHGFPLNSFQWRGVLGPLAASRRCIAPDCMALGATEVAAGQEVNPGSQAAMLLAFLDKLGIAAADIVANDSGGAVAQLLAVRHPERVRSLLLTNCDSEIECPPAALLPVIDLARAGAFADQWLSAWLADKELARGPAGLGGLCYADPSQPSDEAIGMYLGPLVATQRRKDLLHAYTLSFAPNVLAGIEARLRQSRIPTRILWGDADNIFSSAGANYLHTVSGRSLGLRFIAGGKLFWPEERPDIVIEEALALWAAS